MHTNSIDAQPRFIPLSNLYFPRIFAIFFLSFTVPSCYNPFEI